jgi:hypothetical protein
MQRLLTSNCKPALRANGLALICLFNTTMTGAFAAAPRAAVTSPPESLMDAANPISELTPKKQKPEVVPYRFKIEEKNDGLRKYSPTKETTSS